MTHYHLSKRSFVKLVNSHFVVFLMDEGCHLVDIHALIEVSRDLSQDALDIYFAHATHRKSTVNSALNLKS